MDTKLAESTKKQVLPSLFKRDEGRLKVKEQAGCLLRDLLELAQERLVVHAQAFALCRGEGLLQ